MENRSLALRYLSDAVNMDGIGNNQAAFAKYLQSLHVLTLYLNEMFTTLGFQRMLEKNKEIEQVLSMVHECSDRITVIINGGKTNLPNIVPQTKEANIINAASDMPDAITPKLPISEKFQNENMLLLKRYQWRFERSNDKIAKTNLRLELERQMVENAIIAKKKYDIAAQKLQRERVQMMEKEMKKLFERQHLTEKEREKQELYLSVLQYTKNETWPGSWKLNPVEMSPNDTVGKIFQKTIRCCEHPLSQWLLMLQTNIKREIDNRLKQNLKYQQLLPDQSLISIEDSQNTFTETSHELTISSKTAIRSISKDSLASLQKFLETKSSEITSAIGSILEIFYLAYKSLLPDDSEEICHRLIEIHFLDPIWLNLIMLYRISNISSEYKILETMNTHKSSDPEKFGFSNEEPIDNKIYNDCIFLLTSLPKSRSMSEKLKMLVDISQILCGNSSHNQVIRKKLGADDLIPLLCYIIVKSRIPQLSSECCAIEQLFDMKYMFGEEGYALSSFLTALKYIELRKVIDEESSFHSEMANSE